MYECSLPDDCNTQLADSCSAQRYLRYVPNAVLDSTQESDNFFRMEYSIHDDMIKREAEYVQQKLVEFADQFTDPQSTGDIRLSSGLELHATGRDAGRA